LLLHVLRDPDIAPVSLQLGPRAQDLKKYGADAFVTDMAPYLRDFAETAAVLKELDCLITVDTSVAHLAGALGVPTHLLLRYTSDWRWFDHIDYSPWYPTFKIWRQGRDCEIADGKAWSKVSDAPVGPERPSDYGWIDRTLK
jgi:Glycosyltransferase family 9 (heptosyltransferase)